MKKAHKDKATSTLKDILAEVNKRRRALSRKPPTKENWISSKNTHFPQLVTVTECKRVAIMGTGVEWAISFAETPRRRLPLSKTNHRVMELIAQDNDPTRWIGKRIVLFVEMGNFKGNLYPGIRVASLSGYLLRKAAQFVDAVDKGATTLDEFDALCKAIELRTTDMGWAHDLAI